MKKFYYFLQDNPNYPEMIIANSKAEVKALILENIGNNMESSILNILTEEEFKGISSGDNPEFQDPDNFKSGNDFFNSIINGTNKKLSSENANQNVIINNESVTPNQVTVEPETPVKYFEAGGEQFKMENGKIYKKIWKEVSDKSSFRIVNATTLKPITSEKYKIENLIWEEI